MQDPYRPQIPGQDPELARLVAQGQQRRMEMVHQNQTELQSAGRRHLSTAVGAYRGSAVRRLLLGAVLLSLFAGGVGAFLSAMGHAEIGGFLVPGFVIAFAGFMTWVFVPPVASAGAIAAEQAWMTSLPFQLEGYFPLLSATPSYQRVVRYEIRWRDGARPPDRNLLQSVVCAVDPQARIVSAEYGGATFLSGPVSGSTGIRVNRVPVYRNHNIPGHVHSVVDQVLVTLHRSHPIAQVLVRSD
ncbi:MAG: hypothetical protein JST00_45535 [Deltaproteobacteria bacterium]|nr:hypothetical protein [Deltaproteobacteria bacterium]